MPSTSFLARILLATVPLTVMTACGAGSKTFSYSSSNLARTNLGGSKSQPGTNTLPGSTTSNAGSSSSTTSSITSGTLPDNFIVPLELTAFPGSNCQNYLSNCQSYTPEVAFNLNTADTIALYDNQNGNAISSARSFSAGLDQVIAATPITSFGSRSIYAKASDSNFVNMGAYSLKAPPQIGLGTDGSVYAIASYSGSSSGVCTSTSPCWYIGGNFTNVFGVKANYIAMWNGSAWSPVHYQSSLDGPVRALYVDSSGNVYAGGDFTHADSNTANHIALWNGSSWAALGTGLGGSSSSDTVNAISAINSTIFAGGSFSKTGDGITTVNNIAQYNGSNWSTLGTTNPGVNGTVFALSWYSNNLFVGGKISAAGSTTVNNVAVWSLTNTSWYTLGNSTNPGVDDCVYALGAVYGAVYVGGKFSNVYDSTGNPTSAPHFVKFSGTSPNFNTTTTYGTNGPSGTVYSIAIPAAGTPVYVGGKFSTISLSTSVSNVAKFDGSSWSIEGTTNGPNDTVRALAIDPILSSNLAAAGDFTNAGSSGGTHVAVYRSSNWQSFNGSIPSINAVTTDLSGNIYIGGYFSTINGVSTNNIAVFNPMNQSWSAIGNGTTSSSCGTQNSLAATVRALAVYGNSLFVGGDFAGACDTNNTLTSTNYLAIWSISYSYWTTLGTGIATTTSGTVRSIVFDSGGNMYVGGTFTNAGSNAVANIAKWSGSSWQPLSIASSSGTYGPSGPVYSIAVSGSGASATIYVGGSFNQLNSSSVPALYNVARFDGNNGWAAVGSSGPSSTVNALALVSNSGSNMLYAGGNFANLTGSTTSVTNNIAVWNGTSWQTLPGSGSTVGTAAGGFINSLAVDSNNNLYVGGSFSAAGSVSANNIAIWNGSNWSAVGAGTDGTINALAFDSSTSSSKYNHLLMVGSFSTVTSSVSKIRPGIAEWLPNFSDFY